MVKSDPPGDAGPSRPSRALSSARPDEGEAKGEFWVVLRAIAAVLALVALVSCLIV